MPLSIGQILQGRYRILGLLGQGGMGAVYLAEHTQLAGRRFAIKENVPDPSASAAVLAQRRQQFYTEAQVLASLDHPHLPKVSDYFSDGGNEYLVMDYVEGQNLQEALEQHMGQRGKPLPEKPVLIWADQVLDALAYLHGQQPFAIIHRDVKPSNIVLTPQGKAKLVDFGLVKLLDPADPRTRTAVKGLGTPPYTPLEQYVTSDDIHTDPRSDIYALAATLYHLLTGVAPAETLQRLADPASLIPPRQVNPSITPRTEAALLRALEPQPDNRFQTVQEMRQALTALSVSVSASPSPPASGGGVVSTSRGGTRTLLMGIGLGIALIVGLLYAGRAAGLLGFLAALFPTGTPTSGPLMGTSTPTVGLTSTLLPATTAAPAMTGSPTVRLTASQAPSSLPTAAAMTPTSTSPPPPSTPRPAVATPTSAPVSSATPRPATQIPVALPPPALLTPADGASASAATIFAWRWDGPALGPNQGFEVRIWKEGQPDHYGAAEPVSGASVVIDVRGAYGVSRGGEGVYWWTVAVVQRQPYARVGPEAGPRKLNIRIEGGVRPTPTAIP
jgi:serine/threonine-protein kinase